MTTFAPVWHLTRPVAARKIARHGFRLDTRPHFGRLWAHGIYLSLDEESLEIYRDYSTFRRWPYVELELSAEVERPLCHRAAGTPTEIRGGRVCWEAGEAILPLVGLEALADYQARRAVCEASEALAATLIECGYDSLLVEADPADPAFGGNQLIVFDPARVSVVSVGEPQEPRAIYGAG